MVLLHLLLAVAFILLWYNQRRVDKLLAAMRTQESINKAVFEAFELLKLDVDNDRVLKDKTIASIKSTVNKLKKTK